MQSLGEVGGVEGHGDVVAVELGVQDLGGLGILPATGQFSKEVDYVAPIDTVTGFALFDAFITGNWVAWSDGLAHLILPMLTLAAYPMGLIARMTRASMLEVLNADYVRTARAKGLSSRTVIWKHAFRNALIPVVTIAALSLGSVFSGAIITETVFGWQGMGYQLVKYVNEKEPYMILAWMIVTAVFIIIFNLIADILYTVLDPRIRLD